MGLFHERRSAMPARLARDTAISLLIFAVVLAITRSNLAVATAVRPYLEAVVNRSTSLAEIGRTVRDAALDLLTWNPWSQKPVGAGRTVGDDERSGSRSEEPPGGGPDDALEAPGISEPAGLSLVRLPEDGGAKDSAIAEDKSVTLNAADPVANRGPGGARALPPPGTRVGSQAQGEAEVGAGATLSHQGAADGSAGGGQQELATRTAPASLRPTPSTRDRAKLIAPASGQVTYGFGYRIHPIYRRRLFHEGIDIAAPAGTPIRAAAAGKVLRAGPCGTYGKIVELDHGGGVTTLYAHCSRVLVKPGDAVRAGQKIAEVGSTGLSTGPHLHFEVSVDGKPRDPFAYLEGGRRDRL